MATYHQIRIDGVLLGETDHIGTAAQTFDAACKANPGKTVQLIDLWIDFDQVRARIRASHPPAMEAKQCAAS